MLVKDTVNSKAVHMQNPSNLAEPAAPCSDDPFVKASSEMEATYRSGMKLESEGKLDAQAIAVIEARLGEISKRLDLELAKRTAAILARPSEPGRFILAGRFRAVFLVLVAVVLSGFALEMSVGRGFIFFGSEAYRNALPWLFGLASLLLGSGFVFLERRNAALSWSAPTGWVRWLILLPLMTTLSAALVLIAPLGWAALFGWVVGTPVESQVVRVESSRISPESTFCVRVAKLRLGGSTADICLDGRLSGSAPAGGESALVSGRVSALGLYVEELRRR